MEPELHPAYAPLDPEMTVPYVMPNARVNIGEGACWGRPRLRNLLRPLLIDYELRLNASQCQLVTPQIGASDRRSKSVPRRTRKQRSSA